MTYIYKNRERHIVLILRLETGDFDFRIKQKTLSYVNTGLFLRSVYCKDTFFVQYDALFMDLIFAKTLQLFSKLFSSTI